MKTQLSLSSASTARPHGQTQAGTNRHGLPQAGSGNHGRPQADSRCHGQPRILSGVLLAAACAALAPCSAATAVAANAVSSAAVASAANVLAAIDAAEFSGFAGGRYAGGGGRALLVKRAKAKAAALRTSESPGLVPSTAVAKPSAKPELASPNAASNAPASAPPAPTPAPEPLRSSGSETRAPSVTPNAAPNATLDATPATPPLNADRPTPNTPTTIAALVAQTLALNPEIHFYENEISLAKTRQSSSGRWEDPDLSVEIGRKSSRNPDGSYAGDGLAWGVTLAQKFDFSGRNALRTAIARHQVERAESGLAQFRRELAAKAAELGHSLLAAQQRLEAFEEVAARSRAVLDALVQRDPAGVAALLETSVIEADILKLTREATLQRARLHTALSELNMLRGLPAESPLVLANDTSAPAPAPADSQLIGVAFRENYTLRQFESDLHEQGLTVDLERKSKSAWSDVTVSARYSEEKAGAKDRMMGVGVSVPLPFWNGNASGVAEARTKRGQAENALFRQRRDLQKDVLAAAALYRANYAVLSETASVASVERFRKTAELGDRHYRLGAIPVTTYLALQQAYLDSVDSHLTTRVEVVQSASRLTALTGLPLETFFQNTKGGAK